ncbi:MAG TPA: RNA polymerase sigma factor [Chthoniobacterales bacterium]
MTESHENWKICFDRLAPSLLLFARQWAGSHADAEDIVQDAFVRFWKREGAYTEENRGLLFAAVRSTALDFLRSTGRRRQREQMAIANDSDLVEPRFEPDGALANDELARAVERLPSDLREVLVLKVWNGLTFKEIAAILELSQNTAASRYRYALESIRQKLAAHEARSDH